MHAPCEEHLATMFQILRYHKITPGKGLFFRKSEERKLETFTDANWARSIEDR